MLWGREDQEAAVTAALDRACDGRAEILRFVGGPGLGTTTLLDLATTLFLSVKTVEFHLGRVYRKLGARSRGGLSRALATQGL